MQEKVDFPLKCRTGDVLGLQETDSNSELYLITSHLWVSVILQKINF